jgi:hypothetical protein
MKRTQTLLLGIVDATPATRAMPLTVGCSKMWGTPDPVPG